MEGRREVDVDYRRREWRWDVGVVGLGIVLIFRLDFGLCFVRKFWKVLSMVVMG